MSLEIKLVPNLLSSDEEEFIAVVLDDEPPKLLTDFENPLELFNMKIENNKLEVCKDSKLLKSLILEGIPVFTPLFNMRTSISGCFKGENDTFDGARHEKKLHVTSGRRLLNSIRKK